MVQLEAPYLVQTGALGRVRCSRTPKPANLWQKSLRLSNEGEVGKPGMFTEANANHPRWLMSREGNGNSPPLSRHSSGTPVGAAGSGDHGVRHGVTLSRDIAVPAPGQV